MENHKEKPPRPEPIYRGIKAMPFVIGNETFEKLGTIGTASNLLVYLTSVFHMKSITATNVLNVFNGTCGFGTLFGAFLCDTYFGRYNTLGFASVSSFLGMLILTLTAAVPRLHPPDCGGNASICIGPTPGQIAFLFSAFVLLVIGAGGIRPCNLAFGADQFNPKTDFGRRGISSFFNWYYLTYTFAMMLSLSVIVYVQSNFSWPIGLAIPTFLMFLSCALFFLGTRIYVIVLPEGSPLARVAQVVVAAIKKRKLKLPEDPKMSLFNHVPSQSSINTRLPYTNEFRFLSKAAIITPEDEIIPDGSATNPWRLCTIQNVEEVKSFLKLMPIWIAGIVFFISVVQLQNFVVFQALQADRRFGASKFKIPAASYIIFAMLSLTVWIPIFDRLIVPWLRKQTGKDSGMTLLQRMGIGIVLSIVTMIIAGMVEKKRRDGVFAEPVLGFEPRKGAISSISGFWLVPQLVLSGLTEAFTIIGLNELFYKQCPENMRSIGMSFIFVGFALSSYLSSFLTSVVQSITSGRSNGESWLAEDLNKGRLDYFYYLIAVLELLNLIYFLVCAKWFNYNETHNSEVVMEEIKSQEKSLV